MEVYFKNLSSDEVTTEKLVEDLRILVQDAEQIINATAGNIAEESKKELLGALDRLKARTEQIKARAVAGARATDRLHPGVRWGDRRDSRADARGARDSPDAREGHRGQDLPALRDDRLRPLV